MKRLIWALTALLLTLNSTAAVADDLSEVPEAQRSRVEKQREMMQKLTFLVGNWVGERRTFMPDGSVVVSRSSNEIESIVEGTLITIHGRGYAADSSKLENEQFGVIHFDDTGGHYVLRAYGQGVVSTSDVDWVKQDAAQWTAKLPTSLLRFKVEKIDADHWLETISVSHDNGITWRETVGNRFTRHR